MRREAELHLVVFGQLAHQFHGTADRAWHTRHAAARVDGYSILLRAVFAYRVEVLQREPHWVQELVARVADRLLTVLGKSLPRRLARRVVRYLDLVENDGIRWQL